MMNKIRKQVIIGLVVAVLTFIFVSVWIYRFAIDIETPFPQMVNMLQPIAESAEKPLVSFGVISRYSPNIIYKGYQPVMDYLTANSNYQFELRLSNSYQETVQQLVDGSVDVAFLGSFIYLKARRDHGIKCILKPLNDDFEPFFHSVLITGSESPIHSVNDLKNKRLALPSEQSFSGNWLPMYEFKKFDVTVNDLDSVHHFAHHHTVANQILMGNFDAGVVKDRVAREYVNKGIRIFAYSEAIPGSPIVMPQNFDPEILDAVRRILLKIDVQQPQYREIVKTWDREFAYGFTEATDKDYDQLQDIVNALGVR